MNKIEGVYTIKKKWFNNKGKFALEIQGRKTIGTFTYGKTENKIDMGRINGEQYFEFCGSYKSTFGMKYYSVTANVTGNEFEGNFENKRGVKKVKGTVTFLDAPKPQHEAAPASAAEAKPAEVKEEPAAEKAEEKAPEKPAEAKPAAEGKAEAKPAQKKAPAKKTSAKKN